MSWLILTIMVLGLLEVFPELLAIPFVAVKLFVWWEAVCDYRDACFAIDDDDVLRRFRRKQKLYGQTTLQRFREIAKPGVSHGLPWHEHDVRYYPTLGEQFAGLVHRICRAATNVIAWPAIAAADLIAVQGTKIVWEKIRAYADECKARGSLFPVRYNADGSRKGLLDR